MFLANTISEQWNIFLREFPINLWETLYATILATLFAVIIGLPIGVLLVVGEKDNILPLPKPVMTVLNWIINIFRSVPFLILMVIVLPLSNLIIGKMIGTEATIIPLIIAAFPFVARLIEGSIREVDNNLVEAALSMGASPLQVIMKVLIPEAMPSIVNNLTVSFITILGYTAMSGAIGGGGLGNMAIQDGYNNGETLILFLSVILIIILVQLFQSLGSFVANKIDKRVKR